jgi:hypothetical protein
MRIEVHVHGTLYLRKGVTLARVENALRKWLDYLDVENIAEARSLEQGEPGIVFDRVDRVLDICWTGEVGRNFLRRLQETLQELGPLTEHASEVELTYYHENGQDEHQLLFVGPSPESIHQAQRQRMIGDVSGLLSRHFDQADVAQVAALVNQLFDRDWEQRAAQAETDFQPSGSLVHFRRRHLH